jgi:hypothetical protein
MAGRRTHRRRLLGDYLDVEHLGNISSATTSMPWRTEHLDGGRAHTPHQRPRGNYFDAEHLANISSTTMSMPWRAEHLDTKHLIMDNGFQGEKNRVGKQMDIFAYEEKRELIFGSPFSSELKAWCFCLSLETIPDAQ